MKWSCPEAADHPIGCALDQGMRYERAKNVATNDDGGRRAQDCLSRRTPIAACAGHGLASRPRHRDVPPPAQPLHGAAASGAAGAVRLQTGYELALLKIE